MLRTNPSAKTTPEHLHEIYRRTQTRLRAERGDQAHWTGKLASSALSTATAVAALSLHDATAHADRIRRALDWLSAVQNSDGGWGDTIRSRSNISTSWLVYAAFCIANFGDRQPSIPPEGASPRNSPNTPGLERCKNYLDKNGGHKAVVARYGEDRTFSAPILSMLATAGLCDWNECPALPFWMAALPRQAFPYIGLRVVSYALPALIGVGLAIFEKSDQRKHPLAFFKRASIGRVLRQLESITPESGGFLEAAPLTSFVAMNLINAGHAAHPVVQKNIAFLLRQQRADGSWPIDEDLAIWMTTLSVQALGSGDEAVRDWLIQQQSRAVHPFTGSAPGAWGWTWHSGSVPDADDTAGALMALSLLPPSDASANATRAGIHWLLGLQNRDGGWPTFCRGWHDLPFDQSCPDLTAHALRALHASYIQQFSSFAPTGQHAIAQGNALGKKCQNKCSPEGAKSDTVSPLQGCVHYSCATQGVALGYRMLPRWGKQITKSIQRGLRYLERAQQPNGSWFPLWFGNESAPNERNPVLGTSRVLCAWTDLGLADAPSAMRGKEYLLQAQNADGSWGGAKDIPGSIEETALACEALGRFPANNALTNACDNAIAWLCQRIEAGGLDSPAPIGLYFANLWYFEKLYPIIFATAALRQAVERASGQTEKASLA